MLDAPRRRLRGASRAAVIALLLGPLWPTTAARADVRTEARRHFRAGMALITQGEAEAGIAELEAAYEILPHPNVLYNIARAYAESGSYSEAIDYFQRYLESDPPDRVEVLGYIDTLNTRLGPEESPPREATSTSTEAPSQRSATGSAAVATDEELAVIDAAATQMAAVGESAESDVLRARAERLRDLATRLRERRAPVPATESIGPTQESAGSGPETSTPNPTAEAADAGEELVLEGRGGDTYEERVVSSSRVAQSPLDAPNSTTIITAQDLRLSGTTNPGLALRRVAGVELLSASPGDVQISVRGLNQRLSNRAIVLIDGRSAYQDFLGTTLWTLLPVNLEDIDRVEVIRGPASALYGADALTGIINIITRPLGEGRSYLSAGVGNEGQYRVASSVNQRIERVRFRLSGGYEQANQYQLSVGPDRVDAVPYLDRSPNLAFSRLFFGAEAQIRVSDGYTVGAGASVVSGARTLQGVSRLRELALRNAVSSQTFVTATTPFGLSARVFWNRIQTDFGLIGQREGAIPLAQAARLSRQDVVDGEIVFRRDFQLTEGLGNQLIAGIGWRFKEADWDWIRDPVTGDQVRTQHHFNVFLQDTLRIEPWAQVVLSARLDQHPLLSEPQISPRGSVVIRPTPRQSIRITGGTAFRSPTFTESYVQTPNNTPLRAVTAFGVGNPTLNPERIVSVEVGYMLQESEFFTLELNGYYNLVFDQILLSANESFRLADFNGGNPAARYDPSLGAFPLGQLQFDNEDADFQQLGGELGVRIYPVDGLDVYANYAIHETTTLGSQRTLSGRELDSRTSAHKVNAGVAYRAPFGLDVAVDFHWVSNQRWVEQVLDTDRGGTAFVPFDIPQYVILNARIGWRLFEDQLELAVTGQNLVDHHREHPFGQNTDRRFMGHVTFRF